MPRVRDWMDFAHSLYKEREAIQDQLPPGVRCTLSLAAYGYSAGEFSVSLHHDERKIGGFGSGATPSKALEKAKLDLAAKAQEQAGRPQLSVKVLPSQEAG